MKKFFKVVLCLLLCIMPCVMLSACKKDPPLGPVTLTEQQAEDLIVKALSNLESKNNEIKSSMGLLGSITIATTPEVTYTKSNMFGGCVEVWTKLDNNVLYDFSKTTMDFDGETFITYEKSIADTSDDEDVDVSKPETAEFVSAQEECGITTIIYSIDEDGEVSVVTYTIQNELITKMEVTADGELQATITLKYDTDVVIPEMPTVDTDNNPIVWEEYVEEDPFE